MVAELDQTCENLSRSYITKPARLTTVPSLRYAASCCRVGGIVAIVISCTFSTSANYNPFTRSKTC